MSRESFTLTVAQACELRDSLNRWLESFSGLQAHFDINTALAQIIGVPELAPHQWVYHPSAALAYVRTHARAPNVPPQHVRCQWVKDSIRCRKGEGHERMPGDSGHEEPKV